MKYVIKRNKSNYKEVNALFNSLNPGKRYTDTGTKGYPGSNYYQECDYLHYPGDAHNNGKTQSKYRFPGYKLVSLEEFKEIIKNQNMLPENYYVFTPEANKPEVAQFANKLLGRDNYGWQLPRDYYYGIGKELRNGSPSKEELNPKYPIYTYQEWKDLLHKKEIGMFKEVIGYNLKKDCINFEKAAVMIIAPHTSYPNATKFNDFPDVGSSGPLIGRESLSSKKLKEAGVLDLWFEPVYENLYKEGDYVWYEVVGKPAELRLVTNSPTKGTNWCTVEAANEYPEYKRKATQEEIDSLKTFVRNIGSPLTEVTVTKKGVITATIGGNNFASTITDLERVKDKFRLAEFSFGAIGGYDIAVEDVTVRIGCKSTNFQVKLSEIKFLIEEHSKL